MRYVLLMAGLNVLSCAFRNSRFVRKRRFSSTSNILASVVTLLSRICITFFYPLRKRDPCSYPKSLQLFSIGGLVEIRIMLQYLLCTLIKRQMDTADFSFDYNPWKVQIPSKHRSTMNFWNMFWVFMEKYLEMSSLS